LISVADAILDCGTLHRGTASGNVSIGRLSSERREESKQAYRAVVGRAQENLRSGYGLWRTCVFLLKRAGRGAFHAFPELHD